MENFIGTLNVNGDINYQENGSADETFKGLLDNTASFKDLLACLRYHAGNDTELVKAKRCPGSEQLRSGHMLIAQITVGEATCEVYENGYAVFDNGDRKTVVWVPDCPKAAKYYYPATYDEKCKEELRLRGEDYEDDPDCCIVDGTEPEEDRLDEEQLAEMAWYLAVVIAGKTGSNRIWSIRFRLEAAVIGIMMIWTPRAGTAGAAGLVSRIRKRLSSTKRNRRSAVRI